MSQSNTMVQEKLVNNEYGDGVSWLRGSLIGKGGYGCVYLAKLKNPKSKYSCYPPLMAVKSAEVSASGSIQKEKEVFNNVKGCPEIIKCFGEETTRGANGMMVYNILLEYGSGGTLADRIEASGGKGLDELEVKMFARSILKGLSHIHNLGYVHCDLKPDNVLLVKGDNGEGDCRVRAKIGDLGLAKREKQSIKAMKKRRKLEPYWRGTPLYVSPEAVVDGEQGAPCDVWAFGCTVLETLTGKPPWNEVMKSNYDEIIDMIGEKNALPKIPDSISKDAKEFLAGCFVRNLMFRWTADMLLCHPFLSNLPEEGDGGGEEVDDIEDVEIESIVFVCESEGEFSSSSFSNDDDDESVGYWSDEAVEEENGSETEVITSSKDVPLSPDVVPSETMQKFPANLTVTAGLC